MYCPKCDKTMNDDKLEEVSARLKEMGNTLLEEGKCPVCSTDLLAPADRSGNRTS